MASHLYVPTEPVTLRRRFLAHSVEVSVAAASATSGLIIAATAHRFHITNPASSLAMLPTILVYGIAAFIATGGVLALYGLLVRRENIRRELNIEQMGWLLLGVGWAAYMLSVALLATGSPIGVTLGACVATGAAGRYMALIILERQAAAAVQENDPEGDGAHDDT